VSVLARATPAALALAGALLALTACGGGGAIPPNQIVRDRFPAGRSDVTLTTADRVAGGPCSVSTDGSIWYALPSATLPPVDFTHVRCAAVATIAADATPPPPQWSQPSGSTQAMFVATSLQEAYSFAGLQKIEAIATNAGVPVTWLIGNSQYLRDNADFYNAAHARNGDDVELTHDAELYRLAAASLPWFTPSVSVEGAGHERDIAGALRLGDRAFWGITWNSHGTDNTSDLGAPWGSFCADVSSYKRPSPSGDCSIVSFEWTARDLTRAFFANTNRAGYSAEAAYSSDPDDVLLRGGFNSTSGAAYVRRLVDAYAAAGTSQPLVMMSQQESLDQGTRGAAGDDVLLAALYDQAQRDRMKPLTLRRAASAAASFSANPRAIAFPYVAGGTPTAYNGVDFTPATIDYHDDAAGMTFVSGHTLPARIFEYAQDPSSAFDRPLQQFASPTPELTGVAVANGTLTLRFNAPQAMHYGIALWTDPALLEISGSGVTPAGRAGVVIAFDLPPGESDRTVLCSACTSTTFPYSL